MNEHPLKKTLRHLAEDAYPPGTDLWPEIQQSLEGVQNKKRNEMAIRFSNFTRAVAFGAMLVLLTLGLAWVLSNTSPQPAIAPTPSPDLTLNPISTETPSDLPPRISASALEEGIASSNPLEILVSRWEDTLLSSAGWLHLVSTIQNPATQLQNGVVISTEYLMEHWYLLNDQRQVIQEISLMKTQEGEVIQVIVAQDGFSRNLTFGSETPANPFIPDLYNGFVAFGNSGSSFGDVFNATEQYGIKFVKRTGNVEWQVILNSQTGQMISFNEYRIIGDPLAKDPYSSSTPIIEERIEQPPADVLAYLDMESVPYTYVGPSDETSNTNSDYETYRNRGIEKILSGDLEGGLLDLRRAKVNQPLDKEAQDYYDWASAYKAGQVTWDVDWELTLNFLGEVAIAAPDLHDFSGITAADLYKQALTYYVDELIKSGEWCKALQQHLKLVAFDPSLENDPDFQQTRHELAAHCSIIYQVQQGDTCGSITYAYSITLSALMGMNGLSEACELSVGQEILIPLLTPHPMFDPLSLESDSDTIRQRLIDSQVNWTSIYVDAVTTRIDGDITSLKRAQIWFVDPDKSREIYDLDNDNLADSFIFTNDVLQTIFDLKTGQETTQVLNSISPPPLSILNPGSAFALNGMQSSGGIFQPISTDTIAGRETLIVEWKDDAGVLKDRLWIDVYTGVVLKWENLREGYLGTIDGEDYVMNAAIEVLEITYDGMFPEEMFNPYVPNEPIYMEYHDAPTDLTPVFVPTPGNPDISMQYGEIYLLTQDGQTQMLHFPASCLITGSPCPPPEFIKDVPIGSVSTPLIWSPDQTQMVTEGIGSSVSHVWMFNRDSQEWSQFYYAPYFSFPVWSPDGQWLVGKPEHQISDPSDPLLLVSADGREWQEIMADQPGIKYPLAWLDEGHILIQNSLDSQKSTEDGSVYDELQVYNLLNAEITVIARIPRDGNEVTMTIPVLSPDRSQIVYSLIRTTDGTSEIVVIHFMGDTDTSFAYEPGIVSWSPDGEWLVHNSVQDGPCTLTLLRPDGTDARTIFTSVREGSCNFVWSPDRQYMLIPTLAKIGTVPRLYIISIATGETRLIELPDVGAEFWWPVASWVP